MPRRTKIVATLGPATDASSVMDKLLQAGVGVVRISSGIPIFALTPNLATRRKVTLFFVASIQFNLTWRTSTIAK